MKTSHSLMLPLRLPFCLLAMAGLAAGRGQAAEEAPAPERFVELPPLMVAEPVNGPLWRYVEIPGLEVLSRCRDGTTLHLVEEMYRLQQLLAVMLPADLQAKRAVPDTAVLYSEESKPVVAQEVVADLLRDGKDAGGETRRSSRGVGYRSMPNLRLTDRDATSAFFILEEGGFAQAQLALTPDYIRYAIKSRTPSPPPWFVEGFVNLYDAGDFERNPITLSPVEWVSAAETKNLKRDPDYPRVLLPLAEFFSTPGPGSDAALWRAQATLFLRWAMEGDDHPRLPALWKFVARASAEPVTEEIFRECFGLGYVDAQERMSDYLSNAVLGTLRLKPGKLAALPRPTPRPATDLEIARIKGDLERLEIGWVKPRYPQLVPKYAEQARRTLMRAYDKGERDPRLQAVIGLCECDTGNDAGARKFLEAAVQGGVVRPRASYELARLRYAEAQKAPAAPGGRLSAAQATSVLQPLATAWRQPPALLEMYALTADVWARSVPAFTRKNLAMLDEGVAYFPRNAPLIYQAAWLNARQGFKPEAEALIVRGLKAGTDPAFQTRFEQLRANLAAMIQPATAP